MSTEHADLPHPSGPTLVVLTADDGFWKRLQEEARDCHVLVARGGRPEELPAAVHAFIVDGQSELRHWVKLIRSTSVPVIAVASPGAWGERLWLADIEFVNVVPPTHFDIVEQALVAVERLQARPRLAALTSDPSLVQRLRSVFGDDLAVHASVAQLWASLEEEIPDVLVLDLAVSEEVELLGQALRQDARTTRAALFAIASRGTEGGFIYDAILSRDIPAETLRNGILNRFRRSHAVRRLIDTDPLTGLLNRRRARARLAFLLRLATRQKVPLSLAILDLDRFKSINDTYGHGVGDRVIKRLARLLRHSFRLEDIASRIGGEEFLVAMYGATRSVLAERLRQLLTNFSSRDFRPAGATPFRVTFSAGVAEAGRDGHDFQTLHEAADGALYLAKERGRNQILTIEQD